VVTGMNFLALQTFQSGAMTRHKENRTDSKLATGNHHARIGWDRKKVERDKQKRDENKAIIDPTSITKRAITKSRVWIWR
jgi:hypothetical protein